MFFRKIRTSITKLILPFLHKIFQLLKANTRVVNFLNEKKISANNIYNFQESIEKPLDDSDFPEGAGGSQLDNEFSSKYDEGKYDEGKYNNGSLQGRRQQNGQNLLVINTEKL